MTTGKNSPNLTLVKGGKLSPQELAALPLQERIDYIHRLGGATKLRAVLDDPTPAKLVRSLPMTDIYQILHEIGTEESLDILQLASAQQVRFVLDWELWEEWTISSDKAATWLELLMTDEDQATEIISGLDQELLLVFLKKTIEVGGGLGDIINSEDHQREWDHTFDETYYIRFLDNRHSQTILRLIDLIYRQDNPLYRSLMQGVENELLSELEEMAGQFRRARLEDEGFPSLHDAAALYARVAPENFTPATNKSEPAGDGELPPLPAIPSGMSLLHRCIAIADSAALRQEFHYLVNGVMVADGVTPSDHVKMVPVMERSANYLNIALEFLCSGEDEGAGILRGEHLKRLFSLGYSLLARLKDRAGKLSSDNYAAGKVLGGLKMKRPLFYRGLDPDNVDDYREFTGMDDVRIVDQFLRRMESA